MDPKLQRRIQRYGWDRAAAHYERFWSRQLRPAQERLLEMSGLGPGERVLDIACGTGLVTFPAAEAVGPSGAVVGTDLSDEMVACIRTTAQQRCLPHVTAQRHDAEALGFADETFDAALNGLGLMYVPDPLSALKEMQRVLRPGGRAVAAVWGRRERCGWARIFEIIDARVHSEVCPLFFRLGTGETLARTMEAASFTNVETVRLSAQLIYETPEEALAAAFTGGPVALAYSRFDDAMRSAAHAEYLASIASYRVGTGYQIPGEFVIVRGHKFLSG